MQHRHIKNNFFHTVIVTQPRLFGGAGPGVDWPDPAVLWPLPGFCISEGGRGITCLPPGYYSPLGLCSIWLVCISSLQVRYLKIIEKSGYQALPWVRYITQNGGKFTLNWMPPLRSYHHFVWLLSLSELAWPPLPRHLGNSWVSWSVFACALNYMWLNEGCVRMNMAIYMFIWEQGLCCVS